MFGIGNYLRIDDADGGYWAQPGAVGMIDLASYAQIVASKPGQPRGVGMFQFAPDAETKEFINAGGVLLSSDDPRDGTPDGKGLDAIESMLGYRPSGNRWSDCIWDCMTFGTPGQLDAPEILIPTHDLQLELWFANSLFRRQKFDPRTDPLWPKIRLYLAQQLDVARDLSLEGKLIDPVTGLVDTSSHLKEAGAIVAKYAGGDLQFGEQLFADVKALTSWEANEQPIKPGTVYTETWPTNSSTLSSGQDQAWTEDVGDAEVSSNQLRQVTASVLSVLRADVDLATADIYAQASVINRGDTTGSTTVTFRKDGTSTQTYYFAGPRGTSDVISLFKCVTGTVTQIGSDVSITVSLPQTMKGSASGTTLKVFWAGAEIISTTDSSIDGSTFGGKRCGLRLGGGTSTRKIIDDFEAGDLVAGQPTMRRFGLTDHCRAPLSIGTEGVRFF